MRLLARLLRFFSLAAANTTSYPGVPINPPGGLTQNDASGFYGYFALLNNLVWSLGNTLNAFVSSSQTPSPTAAQFLCGYFDHSGAPGGAVTLTTPTAAQIIAQLGAQIPGGGLNPGPNSSFSFRWRYINDGLGQTTTVTGGTGVTVVGNAATAGTNTWRDFLVNVNTSAGTVTMVDIGAGTL